MKVNRVNSLHIVIEVKSVAVDIVKKWKDVISSDSRHLVSNHVKRKKIETEAKPCNTDVHSHDTLKDEKKRRTTVKIPPNNMRTAGMEDTSTQAQPKSRSDILAKRRWVIVNIYYFLAKSTVIIV